MNAELYKYAINKIKRDSRFKPTCCFGSKGATGPTGPQGSSTIQVGTTTTGEPGTNASVTNSGTTQDVILDFTIPAGPTGPTGPAPDFSIGTVTTGNPGTQAEVTITSV